MPIQVRTRIEGCDSKSEVEVSGSSLFDSPRKAIDEAFWSQKPLPYKGTGFCGRFGLSTCVVNYYYCSF